jgi:hypothetical protein
MRSSGGSGTKNATNPEEHKSQPKPTIQSAGGAFISATLTYLMFSTLF